MKSKLFLFIVVFSACLFILTGCGGGSSAPVAGKVITYFHIQDQNMIPITGLSFVYTDPAGTYYTSASSDSNGLITIISTQVGTYSALSVKYGSNTFAINPPLQFINTQADLDNNRVTEFTITINTITGQIFIKQNY